MSFYSLHLHIWLKLLFFFQKQYHTQIDELIEESVKDMIQLLVAKVGLYIQGLPIMLFIIKGAGGNFLQACKQTKTQSS